MTTETTSTIKDVKPWQDNMKREWRIYVHTFDGREGCLYITGNAYNKPNSKTGNLTAEEWKKATKLGGKNGKWTTYYATPAPWLSNKANKCPDCGSYTCGPNCDSNRASY